MTDDGDKFTLFDDQINFIEDFNFTFDRMTEMLGEVDDFEEFHGRFVVSVGRGWVIELANLEQGTRRHQTLQCVHHVIKDEADNANAQHNNYDHH